MREVEGIETAISDVEEVDLDSMVNYDAISIGSPDHYGGPTSGVKESINKLRKLN